MERTKWRVSGKIESSQTRTLRSILPDNSRVAVAIRKGIRIYNLLDNGKVDPKNQRHDIDHSDLNIVFSIAFSPDGSKLATGSTDGRQTLGHY